MPESNFLKYVRMAAGLDAQTTAARYHNAPSWCQRELDRLAEELHLANAKLSCGPADSDTFADAHSGPGAPRRPLGKSPAIEHAFPSGQEATVFWHGDPLAVPVVEIMASKSRLVVEMGGASNVARIRLESW